MSEYLGWCALSNVGKTDLGEKTGHVYEILCFMLFYSIVHTANEK